MEPVSTSIVAALAAGAVAVAKDLATDTVKASYTALKNFIIRRVSSSEAFINAIEEDPQSQDEQRVLAKRLAGLGADEEIRQLVEQLTLELERLEHEPGATAVLDFEKLRAARSFELTDIDFSGTLLRARDATFEGDFRASGLRQQPAPGDQDKKKE